MLRRVSFVATWSVLLLGGCSVWPGANVRPEPARFGHEDEIVRDNDFMVLADRRVFAVMAFLNATGYDEETQGQTMHPARIEARELIAANLAGHPDKVKVWRDYRKGVMRRRLHPFQYQNFALSLSADYPFRRIRPDREVGWAWALRDFPAILNDFWASARLGAVWEQVKPDFAAELRKYNFERMKRQMAFLWSYLRMPRRDAFTLVNVPNLLESHFIATGARYENYYYTVESPGACSYGLNVHEYLHSIINPLVEVNFGTQKSKLSRYYRAGKDGSVCKFYQHPVGFTSECLVRALDHRLDVLQANDPQITKRAEAQIAWLTENGLTLTQPFYVLLSEYERSDKPFNEFLPTLLEHLPAYER
jgi:hypothetical protein